MIIKNNFEITLPIKMVKSFVIFNRIFVLFASEMNGIWR